MAAAGETGEPAAARRAGKRASAFRTIGEVADELDLPAHVLRFWESKFPQLRPLKRGGGRRYYRPEDIVLLRRIRECLYQDGYTIRGVQRLLRDGPGDGAPPPANGIADEPTLFPADRAPATSEKPEPAPARRVRPAGKPALPPATRAVLEEVRRELVDIRALLDRLARHGGKS